MFSQLSEVSYDGKGKLNAISVYQIQKCITLHISCILFYDFALRERGTNGHKNIKLEPSET